MKREWFIEPGGVRGVRAEIWRAPGLERVDLSFVYPPTRLDVLRLARAAMRANPGLRCLNVLLRYEFDWRVVVPALQKLAWWNGARVLAMTWMDEDVATPAQHCAFLRGPRNFDICNSRGPLGHILDRYSRDRLVAFLHLSARRTPHSRFLARDGDTRATRRVFGLLLDVLYEY